MRIKRTIKSQVVTVELDWTGIEILWVRQHAHLARYKKMLNSRIANNPLSRVLQDKVNR